MKERIQEYLNRIRSDEKMLRQMYLISLISALFLASFTIKSGMESGKYIVNSEGRVVGIERRSLSSYEEYPLKVIVKSKGKSSRRDVVISKKAVHTKSNDGEEKKTSKLKLQEQELALNQVLAEAEASEEQQIYLPDKLSDGSKLIWQKRTRGQSERDVIIGIYLLLMGMILYRKFAPGKKRNNRNREELLRGIPRFVNQLVMMLHAGVILSDSFDRICQSYLLVPESAQSYFEMEMTKLYLSNQDHQTSTATVLNEYAGMNNAKELLRISTILLENERRGSDVAESLSRESRFLWEERKIVAEEKGKAIDTKMAGPLGILLILLIVITMAPALLAM